MNFFYTHWKWILSGSALVVFIAIQHYLYLSLRKACREFNHALDSDSSNAGGFNWLRDIRAMFAKENGTWSEDSPLPREAVIDSLDHEIWRTSRYSALQRMGLAAPLIGVLLSALGFMVSPPELTGAVQDIMTKLGPLFVGVFVGALMALINQVYLHFAALELGKVRAKAVRWFDEVVWKAIRQNAHNVLGRAAAETQAAAKSLETSSQQLATCNLTYRDSLLELNRQLADVRLAAQSTYKSFDSFSAMIADMTDRVTASMHTLSTLNNTAGAVENASVVWNVAAAKMIAATTAIDDSAKDFQATCGNFATNFEDVRRAMKDGIAESTGGLINVVNGLTEPLQKLGGSIEQMKANTDKHTELSAALKSVAEQSDQFLVERMALNVDEAELQREMAVRTRAAIEGLQKLTDTANSVGNSGSSLNVAANGLRDASATINNALKMLFDTCNGFSQRCAEMQATMNSGATEAAANLQNAARELAQPVKLLNSSVSRVSADAGNHTELTERLESIAAQAERFLNERSRAVADEGARTDRVEQRLGEATEAIAASASNMQQIQQGLDALVGELRMARESKDAGRRRWLPWLSSTRPNDRV